MPGTDLRPERDRRERPERDAEDGQPGEATKRPPPEAFIRTAVTMPQRSGRGSRRCSTPDDQRADARVDRQPGRVADGGVRPG